MLVEIPVSVGELVDKITILEIKLDHATKDSQINNINRELNLLREKIKFIEYPSFYYQSLTSVNRRLWEIEDLIRKEEKLGRFGKDFIMYARMIYMYNDTRAEIKKKINEASGSDIVEEKIY